MKIRNGDRLWSEAYQRVIIAEDSGKFENSHRHWVFASGITYVAELFVPFPYPLMSYHELEVAHV